MVNYFMDPSALVKYYHTEARSSEVIRFVEEVHVRCIVPRLTVTEVHSAFAVKLRTGEIDGHDFGRLWDQFVDDVTQRRFEVVRVIEVHHEEAERLIRKYARRMLRTLDALQLAVALDVHSRMTLDRFVCSDIRLGEIATEEGLSVLNPAQP